MSYFANIFLNPDTPHTNSRNPQIQFLLLSSLYLHQRLFPNSTKMKFNLAIVLSLAVFASAATVDIRSSCGDCEQQVEDGNTDACSEGICQGCGLC